MGQGCIHCRECLYYNEGVCRYNFPAQNQYECKLFRKKVPHTASEVRAAIKEATQRRYPRR